MGVFEVLFNVLLFIPCGVWVGNHKIQILRKVLRIVVISFLIELLQLLFRIGVFEVHDIIWNTVGGSVGILIVVLFSKIFEGKAQR